VLAEATRARGADETLETLAALGNLGSAAALPRLRAALTAGDSRIRAAAARALRLVPDPEADRLLVATLRRDGDPTVRAAAIFAAGFRKLEPLADALAEAAQSDPVDFVRAGAATLLARPRPSSTRVASGGTEPGR
jgi:HEAT repeat protein